LPDKSIREETIHPSHPLLIDALIQSEDRRLLRKATAEVIQSSNVATTVKTAQGLTFCRLRLIVPKKN
jgi:hypothetical protein